MPVIRILMILLLLAAPARAEEFNALGGLLWDTRNHESTYTWQLEYRQHFHENFAFGITYLNEGAFPTHSRDGHAAQLWACLPLLEKRLVLGMGAGPYFYYDTIPYLASGYSLNDHGWGALLTLDATLYSRNRWLFLIRTNWTLTGSSIDTASAILGIGYQLGKDYRGAPSSPKESGTSDTANEIAVYLGEASVHNKGPAHSIAAAIEYRRRLMRYLEWTTGFLYEGNNSLSRRYGLASQLWLARTFFDDTLHLGIGAGPYVSVDRRRTEAGQDHKLSVSEILTMTVCYRFHPTWGTRFSWNRVITDYERDADVWLLGLSRFF
ncbi:MAG TPA: hypothetical protein PLI53_10795 [Geobacteraceae bacterium]|nr:hypothetical protein [Geobacteraceae bacterium]